MVFPLTSLPPEIINGHVLQFLNADDIVSLSRCIPLDVGRTIYKQAFHDDTEFARYDTSRFLERAKAALYVIGVVEPAANTNPICSCFEFIGEAGRPRMYKPYKIAGDCVISQVCLTPNWVVTLNSQGQLEGRKLAVSSPQNLTAKRRIVGRGKTEDNYSKERLEEDIPDSLGRRLSNRNAGARDENEYLPLTPPSSDIVEASNQLFSHPFEETSFSRVGSLFPTFAADTSGLSWWWNFSRNAERSCNATPFLLEESGKVVPGHVLKFGHQMGAPSCLIENRGIATIFASDERSSVPNGYRSGYRCLNDHLCFWQCTTIPGTKDAKDFVVLPSFIIYLRKDGTVGGYDKMGFCDNMSTMIDELNFLGPFVSVSASFNQIGFIAASNRIVMVKVRGGYTFESLETIDDFVNREKIASLAVGWDHCLALTEDGNIYSWGTEGDCMAGELCLGKLHDVAMMDHVTLTNDRVGDLELTAHRPVKVRLPGRAYAIYADRRVSGILIYEDK